MKEKFRKDTYKKMRKAAKLVVDMERGILFDDDGRSGVNIAFVLRQVGVRCKPGAYWYPLWYRSKYFKELLDGERIRRDLAMTQSMTEVAPTLKKLSSLISGELTLRLTDPELREKISTKTLLEALPKLYRLLAECEGGIGLKEKETSLFLIKSTILRLPEEERAAIIEKMREKMTPEILEGEIEGIEPKEEIGPKS